MSKVRLVLLLTPVALALVFLGGWIWIDLRWYRMVREGRDSIEADRRAHAARTPLRGVPRPGNAWIEYERASQLAEPVAKSPSVLGSFLCRTPRSDIDKARSQVKACAEALDRLRKGAACDRIEVPLQISDSLASVHPAFMQLSYLVNLATADASIQFRDGNVSGAIDRLWDLAQMLLDLSRGAPGYNWMWYSHLRSITLELAEWIKPGRLAPAELVAIGALLEAIDRNWIDWRIRLDQVLLEHLLALGGAGPEALSEVKWPELRSWRYFGSTRWQFASAIQELRTAGERAKGLARRPWAEARPLFDRIRGDLEESKNPLVRKWSLGIGWFFPQEDLKVRAELRLLRVAARYLADGTRLDLEDPFGGRLTISIGTHGFKVWSVGADAVDTGGEGQWGCFKVPRGPDIVFEFRK